MPDEVERRRVAQALREMAKPTWPTLTEAVMGHAATRDKVVERLAELIDRTAHAVFVPQIYGAICGACAKFLCWHGDDVPRYCPW